MQRRKRNDVLYGMFVHPLRQIIFVTCVGMLACNDPVQTNYENERHREIEAFEFHRPLAVVWRELIAVLAEDGFTLSEQLPVEDRTVETVLRAERDGRSGYRVLVRVLRSSKDRFKLSLHRQYQSVDAAGHESRTIEEWNVSGHPQDQLVWTLIERMEPERAAPILEHLRRSNTRSWWSWR
jgi:hypothetical protein